MKIYFRQLDNVSLSKRKFYLPKLMLLFSYYNLKAHAQKFKKITEAPDPNQKIVEDILFESIEGMNYIETKTTIVLTNGEKVVFRKIAFDWGGNYYKQDKYDITAEVYDLLTLKVFVKK